MKTLEAFLVALRMMESDGNYQAVNSLSFLGAYQFGEAALTDLGFVHSDGDAYDNNYGGGWTGKHGINSADEFLGSKRAQDRAMEEWLIVMWKQIELHGVDHYTWSEVEGVTMTPSGMLAGAHLLGAKSLGKYAKSNGRTDPQDPYGTSLSTYVEQLNGYEVPVSLKTVPSS